MKSQLFISFVLMLFSFTTYAKDKQKKHVITFLGDSLTAGFQLPKNQSWPSKVERKLKEREKSGKPAWKVVNAGQSGDTSRGGLKRINWVLRSKPDILVLALGSNDGLRGIPISETQKNLEEIIKKATEKKIQMILVQNLLPENYGKKFSEDFAKLYPELAKKHSLPLTPFLLEGVALIDEMTIRDKIHPNDKGTDRMLENTWKTIEQVISKIEKK